MPTSTFKPTIEGKDGKWVLTAPHAVRDTVWDFCDKIRHVIIWMDGVNATQIKFGAYPGYTARDAFVLVAVRLYIAASPLSFEEFWGLTLAEHFVRLTGSFYATETTIVVNDGSEDESRKGEEVEVVQEVEMPTLDELEENLWAWLPRQAIRRLERKLEELNHYGYRTGVAYDWWQEALEAYRRLQFVDPSCLFIDKDTWHGWVTEADRLVTLLETEYREVLALDMKIDVIKADLGRLIADFKSAIGELGPNASMFDTYRLLGLEIIPDADKRLETLANTFDSSIAKQALRDIKKLTPPTPPKCE
jgi:hypothetical protein